MTNLYRRLRDFIKRHERILMPAALVFGFIVDLFTLNRVDQLFDNLVLLSYLTLAGFCIALYYSQRITESNHPFFARIRTFSALIIQFAFGGLFSGLVIFYTRSGELFTSFPFLIMLAVLFLGNDIFHTRFRRLTFQVTVFYVALLSYSLLITPVLVGSINMATFLLGSIVSLILMLIIIRIFGFFAGLHTHSKRRPLLGGVFTVFGVFYLLYFLNLIPPIPLSLKDGVIAHAVTRQADNTYAVTVERPAWYQILDGYDTTITVPQEGIPLYAFTSIFAPTGLSAETVYEWMRYNPENEQWTTVARIPLSIIGGRDGGYRGYTFLHVSTPGQWRVELKTPTNQVIGRISFEVEIGPSPELVEKEF